MTVTATSTELRRLLGRHRFALLVLLCILISGATKPVDVVVSTVVRSTYGVLDVTVESSGDVLYVSTSHAVFRLPAAAAVGASQLVAGSGDSGTTDGVGPAARFYDPYGITCDTINNIAYISDFGSHQVRRLDLYNNTVTTLAGSTSGYMDGVGPASQLLGPFGIVFHHHGSGSGVLYVTEYYDGRVRMITVATANVTTAAILPVGTSVRYLCITNNGDVLYVMAGFRVLRVDTANSSVLILAGNASEDGSYADGVASGARFNVSYGIALNSDETALIIADGGNQRIRKVLLATNAVTTVAGSGACGNLDGPGLSATFYDPSGVKWHCDASAKLCGVLVADSSNNAVRFVAVELETTPTRALSLSASPWQCVAPVDSIALSLETVTSNGANTFSGTGSITVLLSKTRHATVEAHPTAPMHVSVVQLTSNPIERSALSALRLAFNISLESPLDAVVHWSAANVTLDDETNINFTAYTSNTLPWNFLLLQPPAGGWVDAATPLLSPRTLVLTVTMMCDGAAVLVVRVTVPAPGAPRALAAEVEAAGGYSQIASVLAGGASSGAALGRTMATRSMVLCDADSSVSGGVVDLGVVVCAAADGRPHQAALAAARSAIVSNVVLLCAVSLAMMGAVCLWAALARVAVGAATRVACLPSSLLPVWVAVVPTSTSGAVLLLSRLGSSSCVAADVSMAVVGLVIGVAPALLFAACWGWKVRSGTSAAWRCVERQPAALVEERGAAGVEELPPAISTASQVPQLIATVWRIAMRRRYEWASADGSREGLAPMWPVLLEYRDLRYGAVDCSVLVFVSCFAVLSGLSESASPCRAWSFVSVVLLSVQLVVLLVTRPFSSLFAAVHAVATLSLTVVGVLTQLVFVWAASSSGLWLVQASSMCALAIVGLSAAKMLVDLFQLRKALARRVAELHKVRRQLKAAEESRLKALMPASSAIIDSVLEMKLLLVEDPTEDGAVSEDTHGGTSAAEDLEEFDYERFWDASGAAVGTEVAASLLTQWEV
jgi:hypothetical protein